MLSPDGTQIAFFPGFAMSSDFQLVVVAVDGTHTTYLDGNFNPNADWLPDSTHFMVSSTNNTIGIIDVFENVVTEEFVLPMGQCRWFDLSPDGRHIVFSSLSETTGNCNHLNIIDVDGSNLQSLPLEDEIGAYAVWSFDSRQLAIPSQQGVFLIDIENMENVHTIFPHSAYVGFPLASLSWSPDNTQIVFTAGQSFDIYTVSVRPDIGTPIALNLTTQENIGPIWSPDGGKIAFLSTNNGNGRLEIYIMDADGTDVERLTYNDVNELNLVWLP
jgi:Tol biopolymer transport system component